MKIVHIFNRISTITIACLLMIIFFKSSSTHIIRNVTDVEKNKINPTKPFINAVFPLNGNITSSFGYRIHPIYYNLDFHPAIDIGSSNKSKIHSILPGVVKETGFSEIYGKYIIISHSNNIESKYCHCQEILKEKGNNVNQGQVISTVGHTGLVTGDHLHLEIKINNVAIDPLLLIKQKNFSR